MKDCTDYSGYEWGWITSDGERHESGNQSRAMPGTIVGIWSTVERKGIEVPFRHEIFLEEYRKPKSDEGSWAKRPIAMLLKLSRNQSYNFAYADQTDNALIEGELILLSTPPSENTKKLQLWKCKKCGHTFYTPLEKKQVWYLRIRERFLGVIGHPVYTTCQVCSELKAVKVKIVTKKVQG